MTQQDWLWPKVRAELLSDLERLHDAAGPWHLLLFTGDLTNTGTVAEYDRLGETLERVFDKLRSLGSQPALLCVPGNHDLVRPDSKSPVVKALSRWHEDPEIQDQVLSDSHNEYRATLQVSFGNYTKWWDGLAKPYACRTGKLPGDFSATVDAAGIRLGVAGLNSSFLQLTGGDYFRRLALDVRQLHGVCGDIQDWHAQHHASILMTHHPVDWLHDKAHYESDIAPPGAFTIHMYGHMHENSDVSVSQSGGELRCYRQAASLFGLETFGEAPRQVKRSHGWAAGRVEILRRESAPEGKLITWPRAMVRKAGGGIALQPDPLWTLNTSGMAESHFRPRDAHATSAEGPSESPPVEHPVDRPEPGNTSAVSADQGLPLQTVLILALGEDEYLATLDWMPGRRQCSGKDEARYDVATLPTSAGAVTVILARPSIGKPDEVRAVTEAALADHRPDWTICIGTGTSAPSTQVWLGDVVVANEIRENSAARVATNGTGIHPKSKAVLGVLPSVAREAAWRQRFQNPRPKISTTVGDGASLSKAEAFHLEHPRDRPVVKPGELRRTSAIHREGSSSDRVVVEDESLFAMAEACELAGQPALLVVGVSSVSGFGPEPGWLSYAGEVAAAFVGYVVQAGTLAPPPVLVANEDRGDSVKVNPGSDWSGCIDLAISNVIHFGDTDVFPRAYETGVFRELGAKTRELVAYETDALDRRRARDVPHHIRTLAHASLSSYRWVTQQDPIYNLILLASAISIGGVLEGARVASVKEVVFSYRYSPQTAEGRLFNDEENWDGFLARAKHLAEQREYVVRMDIAEFYGRVSHETLAAGLKAATTSVHGATVARILQLLRFCSPTGNGLPIGGPAARILAECYLKDTDASLLSAGIEYCRYADDYAAFADSEEQARRIVAVLSQTLYEYDGLSLQKLKTRIMRRSEFLRTFSLGVDGDIDRQSMEFLRLRLRFDPYSQSAEVDYAALRGHVSKYDVVGMLAREAKKGALHVQLAKKLLHGARFIADEDVNALATTLADNLRAFAPIIGSVIALVRAIRPRMDSAVAGLLARRFTVLLDGGSKDYVTDLQRAAIVRLLSAVDAERDLVARVIGGELSASVSPLVRKECIWGLVRLRETVTLKELLPVLASDCSPWERRALLFASFLFGDSGRLARESARGGLSSFESLVSDWAQERAGILVES
jgi:predicted MPP superfamily phosphohydrolase